MSSRLEHLLTIPVDLVRRVYAETPDAEGEQLVTETVVGGVLAELQQAGSREDSTGSVQITTYRFFLAEGTPLRGWDAIRLVETDELLELEGDAFEPRSPLTGDAHVEGVAVRVDYGREPEEVEP